MRVWPDPSSRAKGVASRLDSGAGGVFHERALTDSGFFEERFFFGSINFGVSLDSIVVSVLMPITSLFFELRAPFVSIFESRHFSAVFDPFDCLLSASALCFLTLCRYLLNSVLNGTN